MHHLKFSLPLLLRSSPKFLLQPLKIQSRSCSLSKTREKSHPKPKEQTTAEVFNEIFLTEDKNEQMAALENLMKNANIEIPPPSESDPSTKERSDSKSASATAKEGPGHQKPGPENGDLPPPGLASDFVRQFSKGSLKNVPGLFIVPGADGCANRIAHVGQDFLGDLYGFEFPQNDDETYKFHSISDAAKYYVQEMKKIQPNGPYNIGGISTGGPTAFEMALLLTEKEVTNLVFLESTCNLAPHLESMWTRYGVFQFAEMLLAANIDLPRKVEGESLLAISPLDNMEILVQHFVKVFPHVSESDLQIVLKRLQHNIKLNVEYTPAKTFSGNVILVKARGQSIFNSVIHDHNYDLEEYCKGPLSTHSITGSHAIFVNPEYADQTTTILNKVWSSMSTTEGDSASIASSEAESGLESKVDAS